MENTPGKTSGEYVLLCFNCKDVPIVRLIYPKLEMVKLSCKCGFSRVFDINTFIEQTEKKQEKYIKVCSVHNEEEDVYCQMCKAHCCVKCAKDSEHNSHFYETKSKLIPTEKIKKINEDFSKAKEIISDQTKPLRDEIFAAISQKESEYINGFYSNNLNINKKLIQVIELIINQFEKNSFHYNLYLNIVSNTNFNFTRFSYSNENISTYQKCLELISYYQTNFIITQKYVELSNLRPMKTLKTSGGTENTLTKAILLQDKRLCCAMSSLKIYNLVNFKCEMTISTDDYLVSYVDQLKDGRIAACYINGFICLFEVSQKTYKNVATLKLHQITAHLLVPLTNDRIVSCSFDGKMKIWKAQSPYKQIISIDNEVNNEIVSFIQLKDKEILVAGSLNETITFWDLTEYKCLNTFPKYGSYVFQIDKNTLIFGTNTGIMLFDLMNMQTIVKITDTLSGPFNVFGILRDGSLCCGCANGKIYQLDMKKFKWKQNTGVQKNNNKIVSLIPINERVLISATINGVITTLSY